MKVYFCGKEDCEKGHFFGPAVRSHYLIHFVMKGKGIYKTESDNYKVKGGEAFLIRPEEVTYYRADTEEPWSYAWLAFDGEGAASLLARYFPDTAAPVCAVSDVVEASAWFEELFRYFGNAEENHERVLGYFYLIMACLVRRGTGGVPGDEEGYFKRAVSFMRHNYSYPIQISQVADYVGIDRTYLYKIFMRQEGVSPKQYLSKYRLSEAKEMLLYTQYRITEIAYSCGYHDSSSFCKAFQKEMGMTPAEFRKF